MRIFPLLAVAAALAACSTPVGDAFDTRQNAGPCPATGSLYDASRIVKFVEPDATTFDKISYTGEIVDVRLFCRYADRDPIDLEIEIDFAFGKGAAGDANAHDYTYWVAVTRRSQRVLEKVPFTVRADFRDGQVTGATEVIRPITIPRVDETISGVNFEVLVGFELTDEQLEFNRGGNRFRLGAGQPRE